MIYFLLTSVLMTIMFDVEVLYQINVTGRKRKGRKLKHSTRVAVVERL